MSDAKSPVLAAARAYLPKDAVDEYWEKIQDMEKKDAAVSWDEEMDTLSLCVIVDHGVQALKDDGMNKEEMRRFFRELLENHYG